MRERHVIVMFKRAFDNLPVYTLKNTVASGWPDKLIQVGQRVVLVELKHVVTNRHGDFRLNEFRQDQAAHFAKWQKENGLCFLMIGISNAKQETIGYGVLTVADWKQWLDVNKWVYTTEALAVFTEQPENIRCWFDQWLNSHACVITNA